MNYREFKVCFENARTNVQFFNLQPSPLYIPHTQQLKLHKAKYFARRTPQPNFALEINKMTFISVNTKNLSQINCF